MRTKQRFTFMMDRKYAFASILVPEDLAERRDGAPLGRNSLRSPNQHSAIRRMHRGCSARAVRGYAAAPPSSIMKSRR